MNCKICKSIEYIEILNKENTPIWTGSSEECYDYFPCHLKQCTDCGHVYQEVPLILSEKLKKIYESNHAQVSTPLGSGNWGLSRAWWFLEKLNYKLYTSAIEIGCADGFILKFLESNGYNKLIGIEPSLPRSIKVGKIEFINAFVDEATSLNSKVELIYSNGVLEHIENVNGILHFSKNHLTDDGELFFTVPNAERELDKADVCLFLHEHVHHYTKDVITHMLAINGFKVNLISEDCSALYVSASLDKAIEPLLRPINLYSNYSNLLNQKLESFNKIIDSNANIIIHGVNNKLNNILGWSKQNISFTLVDNDDKKHGQYFFGRRVQNIKDLDLKEYDCVIIIPTCFYEAIKSEYMEYGFTGKIYNV